MKRFLFLLALLGYIFVPATAAPIRYVQHPNDLSNTSANFVSGCARFLSGVPSTFDLLSDFGARTSTSLTSAFAAVYVGTVAPTIGLAEYATPSTLAQTITSTSTAGYTKRAELGRASSASFDTIYTISPRSDLLPESWSIKGESQAWFIVGIAAAGLVVAAILICACGKMSARITTYNIRRRDTSSHRARFWMRIASSWLRFKENYSTGIVIIFDGLSSICMGIAAIFGRLTDMLRRRKAEENEIQMENGNIGWAGTQGQPQYPEQAHIREGSIFSATSSASEGPYNNQRASISLSQLESESDCSESEIEAEERSIREIISRTDSRQSTGSNRPDSVMSNRAESIGSNKSSFHSAGTRTRNGSIYTY